ncbi:CaiB/BaiF CoA-transferase family protein [Variovorax sp. J22G21]|uniref:CaiB/BaiF CoA transferase family protein n=1 Tax=Variovorax fucosicus TaxID=3053517 RepID=UPI002574F04D|nr:MULTISPECIES: CaiB/BaiF CoA-transferase family protein [unclassified Variovorax]MDM0037396.1 CaiB/BaiF CoA-transferase family protein [Variovorax sp. J22R193]MDM0062173.1 CaiB/BaiF CoA-transferase family protein [Variovorax sp. J22G21]
MSAAPLEGLRVVDFTRVLSGPSCTKTLRDLGAEVTKIEPPAGDLGRAGVPHVGTMSMYYAQQNAGKRNISLDLNWPEAREIVGDMCRSADVIVENFRPGTLARFGFGYDDVVKINPKIVYVSISGYGQTGPWRNRPAFAPTVHAETGLTDILQKHYEGAMVEPRNDACSHADVYTGLQGVIAVLAALRHRERTGEGQYVDVCMAATMLSVNERAGALLTGLDVKDEPYALSANESPLFELPDGRKLTIASSPVASPMFLKYCSMMRRTDLFTDPRFASATQRKANLESLMAEVKAWILTFTDLDLLQAQVSEAGLAIGIVRSTQDLAESEWAKDWGAIVNVDDRDGGTVRMPGPPWRFGSSELPAPGVPYFQGESNSAVLGELGLTEERIEALRTQGVLRSRRSLSGAFD